MKRKSGEILGLLPLSDLKNTDLDLCSANVFLTTSNVFLIVAKESYFEKMCRSYFVQVSFI